MSERACQAIVIAGDSGLCRCVPCCTRYVSRLPSLQTPLLLDLAGL